jgi:hypothetical protein
MKMNLKTETREIDGMSVTCTQFPALRATTLFARLLKLIGPSISALMRLDPTTDLEKAGGELGLAFSEVNPDEMPGLICKVLEGTAVRVRDDSGSTDIGLDRKENVDLVFSGQLLTMFKVLGFALQVNYRDFRSGSAPAAPGLAS